MENFDNSFVINGKTYNFRKWKVKDRLALSKAHDKREIRNILVYNCLEDKSAIFDENQYQFALLQIREKSLKKKIVYTLTCEKCEKDYEYEIEINDIFKPINSGYKIIKADDIEIEVQDIKNREFYENKILNLTESEEQKLVDFALHIKSINGDENFDFNKIMDFITDLDVDTFENIISQWLNIQFKVEKIGYVKCPFCGNEEKYMFDSLPGFFPESWCL